MSKDKGSKNKKKAPADKTSDKSKVLSSYKDENKNGEKDSTLGAFVPKPDAKGSSGKHKS